MIATAGRRLLGGTVRLAGRLHLRWVVSAFVRRLPQPVRLRLRRVQVKVGYMEGLTLVPEDALDRAFAGALELLGGAVWSSGAAYLEFGVYVGTSMACMHRAAAREGADGLRLIGFDSFQGMPKGVEEQDDQRWHAGDLSSDMELTRANLRRLGVPLERVELVPGWFDESLTDETRRRLGISCAPVVMMDCVLSASTRVALDFLTPLIKDRTVIFFDDWAVLNLADRGLGERVAFEEWLSAHPELAAEALPGLAYSPESQAFLVSLVTKSASQ